MLVSTCSMRLRTAAGVKFRSRVFTALNRLPSTATTPPARRPTCRQSITKCRQVARSASPFSRRKSAIVLKSGARRPISHISSTLRQASRSKRRLDGIWFK